MDMTFGRSDFWDHLGGQNVSYDWSVDVIQGNH